MTMRIVVVCCLLVLGSSAARAQEPFSVRVWTVFYADNTEFTGPYRDGDTIFGTSSRIALTVPIADNVHLRGGVFADNRFGSENVFELVRPIAALAIGTPRNQVVLGTLDTATHFGGPDLEGPHGLLAPLQTETLAFNRPYEAGFQWLVNAPRVRQDAWLNWQKLNTPQHREVFDVGMNSRVVLFGPLRAAFQGHAVHSGGQVFASGAVADSYAFGPGAMLEGKALDLDKASLEVYALYSKYTPNREDQGTRLDGSGTFVRAAAEKWQWRAHVIWWQAQDFVTREGDANFLSIVQDGSYVSGTRKYAETGLARTFNPADRVRAEFSARYHRIDSKPAYSYRILGIVDLTYPIRRRARP